MSKKKKRLEKWRTNPPTEEQAEAVFSVLRAFGFTKVSSHGGSHTTWYHSLLKSENESFLDPIPGEFSFATKKGRTVKKCYLKDVVKAINIVESKGASCNEEN